MGGHTKSTGGNKSEFRKESTKKFKKEKLATKKSKFKIDKFGYKVKKNPFETYQDKNLVGSVLGPIKDSHNLFRRSRFADQNNIDISKMSTKEIMSKSFKAKLMSKGYLDPTKSGDLGKGGGNDNRDADTNKASSIPPQAGIFPGEGGSEEENTTPLYGDEENLTAEEIKLKNKRKGRKKTVLTSVTGDTSEATLGKKTLLGT